MDEELRLDGNAVAGLLAELFGRELTVANVTCAGCGATRMVGALLVYRHGMGTVMRCAACDTVLLRVAQIRGQTWLDARGIQAMHMATGDAVSSSTLVAEDLQ